MPGWKTRLTYTTISCDVPVFEQTFGAVTDLPNPQTHVFCVVSRIVLLRDDVLTL